MTFFEKTKLFFFPLKDNKLLTFFSCIKYFTWGFYPIIGVLVIRGALQAVENNDPTDLKKWIFWFTCLFLVYMGVSWAFRKSDWPHLHHRVEKWVYARYMPKMMSLDGNYLEKIGTGRMLSILQEGNKVWVELLTFLIQEVSKIAITGIFLLSLLWGMGYKYVIFFLIGLIIVGILIVWVDNSMMKYRQIRKFEKSELSRYVARIIMSRNEILQNNTLAGEMRIIHENIDRTANANDMINRSLFVIFNLIRILTFSLRIIVLFIIGYWVFLGTYSLSDFVTIMATLIVFEGFLFGFTEFYKNFTKEFVDLEKLWDTFEHAPQLKGYTTGAKFSLTKKDIKIENISYGYNESKVFENFSLNIKYGKKTALVGASGGGKTTLMKLIAGYLHPENGSISVLGNILDETALKTYYPHIGYLAQDPGVFDATIRENLVSVIPDKENEKNEDDLISVLKLAQCDFVFGLEKGLDTEIGEKGVRLSGGQKQRLAIAKIFLKNPEIIFLDEPTSALDSFSEEKITEALDTLFKGRTVIIIAHRLQTVKKADEIIVIEGGKVVEKGNHTSLSKGGGIYAKMLELQSGF